MTPIADMVERMFAQGATADLVVLAIRAVETIASASVRGLSADERRTRDADRKREKRKVLKFQRDLDAAKANDVAASVRTLSADASADSENAPNNLLTFSQQSRSLDKEVKKEKKKEGVVIARERGTRMAAGAILTDEFHEAAIKLGADAARVPDMWAEFVDYWTGIPGSRGLKCNWLGTWRNRVRDVLSRGYKNGSNRQGGGSGGARGRNFSAIALERARAAGLND